ncbi:hypothetical protein [Hymenobacter wooponensis]|uniref:Uncharacterized protein n=1 Tax=Hymenobacter wooponensis TaxID=1525360 RepID=A0A4Z0MT93_9BACT|nr:hypothetical protein [Hymenobacter wooponensis]TGD82854.1 hypothetical protein EU557_03480 [Hymenobacter wooponensis]
MSTTPTYTEASIEEAFKLLDYAVSASRAGVLLHEEFEDRVEQAAALLRPATDAAALEQLAQQHPIDLPWMQPVAVIASDTPAPTCSPLSCDGCAMCEEGGNNE